jgi:hypothetical protein
MRGLPLLAVAVLLVAGCAEPAPAPDPADAEAEATGDPGRTARAGSRGGGDGEGDNRTLAVLASASGGPEVPGTYPLPLDIPMGGATAVTWSIEVVPLAAIMLDGVQGPGCETVGWHSGITSSGTTGYCSQVSEGTHEWTFSLNAPVVSYRVEVVGRVWDLRVPSNGTEP